MATAEAAVHPHDRHSRRRPFSSWMKRLANLKNSNSDPTPRGAAQRTQQSAAPKPKKTATAKNYPYPVDNKTTSNHSVPNSGNGHLSFHTPPSGRSVSNFSPSHSKTSLPASHDGHHPPTISNRSTAPTLATNADTIHSDAATSKAGTTGTVGATVSSNGISGGEGSTFSSPAPSVRSLTTTLTTIQSTAPSNLLAGQNNQTLQPGQAATSTAHQHASHFTHQFPSSSPASAIPSHVTNQVGGSGGHPATYTTATANNILTDNASIMTLASSSKRRRRNSLDTNASVRALAPSSIFGGSRESLPLSVLSANVGDTSTSASYQARHPSVAHAGAERASVYSSQGNAPALTSERNSYYASKQPHAGDGASVRSGLVGHARNDSITGSIGGIASAASPLASPREVASREMPPGRLSRRSSGWGEVNEEDLSSDDDQVDETKKSKGSQGSTLLAGQYRFNESEPQRHEATKRRKIAAFDFDSTLIATLSGNVFSKDSNDWRWWHNSVPASLKQLASDGYCIAILSNQGSLGLKDDSKSLKSDKKSLSNFKAKVTSVFNQLDVPIILLAASARDEYRKPRTGMWTELLEELDLDVDPGPDLKASFFVGDAGGRAARGGAKADHSCSDRNLAVNVGIDFKTPEEFFLNEPPNPFVRDFEPASYMSPSAALHTLAFDKRNALDIVLFCGSPASGKSTFYRSHLKPLGYHRVNQDTLKTRDKCVKVAEGCLTEGDSVAIDNTNADRETRSIWIQVARKFKVPIRCVYFTAPPKLCQHNDTVRAIAGESFNPDKRTILPHSAFSSFASRFKQPTMDEGFQDVVVVHFNFQGDAELRKIWSQYWI
ncbi:MAG: hypothetical protein Q9220_004057 [cf. Caloplaca sp. 1 TL-2023]